MALQPRLLGAPAFRNDAPKGVLLLCFPVTRARQFFCPCGPPAESLQKVTGSILVAPGGARPNAVQSKLAFGPLDIVRSRGARGFLRAGWWVGLARGAKPQVPREPFAKARRPSAMGKVPIKPRRLQIRFPPICRGRAPSPIRGGSWCGWGRGGGPISVFI